MLFQHHHNLTDFAAFQILMSVTAIHAKMEEHVVIT